MSGTTEGGAADAVGAAPQPPCAAQPAPLVPEALIKNGWFAERQVMWPGEAKCLKVQKVLEHRQSKYQVPALCRTAM